MEQKLSLKNLEKIENSGLLTLAPDLLKEIPFGLTRKDFNQRLAPLAAAIASNHLNATMAEAFAHGTIFKRHNESDAPASLHAQDLLNLSDALEDKAFFGRVLCRKRAELLAKSAPQGFSAADMALWQLIKQAQYEMQREMRHLSRKRRVHELQEQANHDNALYHEQSKRPRTEKDELEFRESLTKEENEIKEKYSFIRKFTTSCSKLENMAESDDIKSPNQQVCIALCALQDYPSLREEVLFFAQDRVSALGKKNAKDRAQRKARELFEIASEIKEIEKM